MNSDSYVEIRHPKTSDLNLTFCYLCNKQLGKETKSDHVIPNSLFTKGSPFRPQLLVHNNCNNLKSKDDRFFVKQIQLMCSLNPKAGGQFMEFLKKAQVQKEKAFLVGKSKEIPDYKLARSLLEKNTWGWKVWHNQQELHAIPIPEANQKRMTNYMKNMCRALFVRNVPGAKPKDPEIIWIQYKNPLAKQDTPSFIDSVKKLVDGSSGTKFSQDWIGQVMYVGSRVIESENFGFLYLEFYNTIGILAAFSRNNLKSI
jgi:hypothetical protein